MGNAFAARRTGATHGPDHFISFFEKHLGQIRAILARDAGNQSSFVFHKILLHFKMNVELINEAQFRLNLRYGLVPQVAATMFRTASRGSFFIKGTCLSTAGAFLLD
jgi:hypothetical protein